MIDVAIEQLVDMTNSSTEFPASPLNIEVTKEYLQVDAELVYHINNLARKKKVSPLDFTIWDIAISESDGLMYPALSRFSPDDLSLRFSLIKLFNKLLIKALPMIDFSENNLKHEWSLGSCISKLRSIIFLEVKKMYFEEYYNLFPTSSSPTITIDRLMGLDDNGNDSNCVFMQAFNQMGDLHPSKLRSCDQAWSVQFVGEGASDAGGPYRESMTHMSADLQSEKLPLFIPCTNAQLAQEEVGIGNNRDKYIPKPSCNDPTHMKMFEFLGKLMGVAVRSSTPLPLDLPSVVWKPLIGLPTSIKDLKDIDQFCGQCLDNLLHPEAHDINEENFSSIIFENFTTVLSDKTVVELKENGESEPVTFENRVEYVELVKACRLSESKEQIEAIKQGLYTMLPSDFLNTFTWQELETLVCGQRTIDIEILKQHTNYEGYCKDSEEMEMFWECLSQFSEKERALFLRFASGMERLPARKDKYLTISRLYGCDVLPHSATCFFTVKIPHYSSLKIMKKLLLVAITSCSSIDADFDVM